MLQVLVLLGVVNTPLSNLEQWLLTFRASV